MRKLIRDPEIYFLLGFLGLIIAIPSKNLYVNIILLPMFFIMQIIGVILIVKKYLNERKSVKQGGKNITDDSYIKPDRRIWIPLLAAFSSLLAVVSSLVLLLLLNNGNLDTFRYFIIATSCIHVVIVVISFIAFFKILAKKRQVKV